MKRNKKDCAAGFSSHICKAREEEGNKGRSELGLCREVKKFPILEEKDICVGGELEQIIRVGGDDVRRYTETRTEQRMMG